MTTITLLLCSLLAPPPDVAHALADLGSDSWQAREAAHARLQDMGPRAMPALRAAVCNPDPEIAARCRRLLEQDELAFLDSLIAIHGGQWPCLDYMARDVEHAEFWSILIDWYRSHFGGNCPDYPGYRAASMAVIVDMRRAGVPDCMLKMLVRRMVAIDGRVPVAAGGRMREVIPAPDGDE